MPAESPGSSSDRRSLSAVRIAVPVAVLLALVLVAWFLSADEGPLTVATPDGRKPAPDQGDAITGAGSPVTRSPLEGIPPSPAPADVSHERAECALSLTVVDERNDQPIPGALVLVSLRGGGYGRGTTAEDGSVCFKGFSGERSYLVIQADGFAAYRANASPEEDLHEARLRRAGSVVFRLFDRQGARLPHQTLWINYGRMEDLPGLLDPRLLLADGLGEVRLDDLDPGPWEVLPLESRGVYQGERAFFDVHEGGLTQVDLVLDSMPLDRYASGTVELPADACLDDEDPAEYLTDDTIRNYVLEEVGGDLETYPLQHPGEYFISGHPGESLRLRVTARWSERRSEPFTVRMGEHGVFHVPRWEP